VGAGTIVLRARLRVFHESEVEPATGLPSAEVPVRGSTLPLGISPGWNEWKFKLSLGEFCIRRRKIRGPASNRSTFIFSIGLVLKSMGKQVPACRARFLSSMVPGGK